MPIQDHAEMGFSGADGDPGIEVLLSKLEERGYYQVLVTAAFGDPAVDEARLQEALAAFVRSIQSFDSRYDRELQAGAAFNGPFPGLSELENRGKLLFESPPPGAPLAPGMPPPAEPGAGCGICHRAPAFDIDPASDANAFGAANGEADDTVTRSPTLRDMFAPDGELNGPLMHNGGAATLEEVIFHYNAVTETPGTDARLLGGANGQRLDLSQEDQQALVAFLKTLGGSAVYSDERWSDPF